MEAYFLFRGGVPGAAAAAAADARCEEQDEDIGAPSDSEEPSPSTSSSDGSAAGSSSSSSELDDDASSPHAAGGGFGMSALMAQLPVKRGLSRFFDGRSQSFASLAAVASLEDLAKPPRKRLKPSRSCGGGLDAQQQHHRGGGRLLPPPRRGHCGAKPADVTARRLGSRAGSLAVLGAVAAAQRRPPLAAPPARPDGVAAGKALVVS